MKKKSYSCVNCYRSFTPVEDYFERLREQGIDQVICPSCRNKPDVKRSFQEISRPTRGIRVQVVM